MKRKPTLYLVYLRLIAIMLLVLIILAAVDLLTTDTVKTQQMPQPKKLAPKVTPTPWKLDPRFAPDNASLPACSLTMITVYQSFIPAGPDLRDYMQSSRSVKGMDGKSAHFVQFFKVEI